MSKKYVKVAKTSELNERPLKKVQVEGHDIALARVDGKYFAFDNVCPHRGGPLSNGELAGDKVACPWHGGEFNCCTGDLLHPPPVERIRTYPVRVAGEDIEVAISGED
jgi:nitrite reductase/ring-hydroxylating ferredoxin subunit